MAVTNVTNAAEVNLINKTAVTNAKIREIDFAERFGYSVKKLTDALGVTRKVAKQAGAVLKTYKATGTLQSGAVAEGEIIPLSKYTITPVTYKEMTLKKWRKATSAEAIIDKGFDQAVGMTTDEMVKDVQKGIRADFFTFLATGTGTAAGVGLQATLANAWGKLQVLFDDDAIDSVYFVHPLDVADYLGKANITVQSAFGMSYIEDFLGLGTVFMNSSVPQGKIYATAKENIVLYYIAVGGADLGNVFNFTSDATGYIGIHEEADYVRMTAEDVVVSGIELFAEKLDGVVVGTISAATDA